jgi:hypothetical protein
MCIRYFALKEGPRPSKQPNTRKNLLAHAAYYFRRHD